MLADPAVGPDVLGVQLARAQARSAAVDRLRPAAGVRREHLRPRSSAQRRLTAVGRVLPEQLPRPRRSALRAAPASRTVRSAQHQAVGGRDPDRRRAAHGQAADRVRHLLGRLGSRARPPRRGGRVWSSSRSPPAFPAHRREGLGGAAAGSLMARILSLLSPRLLRWAPDRMLRVAGGSLERRFHSSRALFRESRVLPLKGDPRNLGFSTRAVHAGQEPDPRTGAVDGADLSDVHLRAGAAGRGGQLRVRPGAEPHPRARSRRTSPPRGRGSPATPSPPAWPPSPA